MLSRMPYTLEQGVFYISAFMTRWAERQADRGTDFGEPIIAALMQVTVTLRSLLVESRSENELKAKLDALMQLSESLLSGSRPALALEEVHDITIKAIAGQAPPKKYNAAMAAMDVGHYEVAHQILTGT